MIADINYVAAAASWNWVNVETFGLSFINVDYGDIIGTRLISAANIATDELGYEDTGLVSNVGAYAFGLAYARAVTDVFLFGGGVRLVGQQLGQSTLSDGMTDNNMLKVAFDLGVKYYTPVHGFRFAKSIRNFANSIKYEEVSSPLPLTFAVGGTIDLFEMYSGSKDHIHSLLAAVEFSHANNYTERVHLNLWDRRRNRATPTPVGIYLTM